MNHKKILQKILTLTVFVGIMCVIFTGWVVSVLGKGTQPDFYVAVNGNDVWSGRLAAPDSAGADGPFATLERARDAVKELKKIKAGPVTVQVSGGTYYLNESFILGPEDSGMKGAPVTYRAAPNQAATLSGGKKFMCNWKPFRDGIWMCELPEVREEDIDFMQLFINGERQIRARYPNGTSFDPATDAYLHAAGADEWSHKEIYYVPETYTQKRWAYPQEGVMHIFPMNYWGNMQFRIRGLERQRNAILLGEGGWQLNETLFGSMATGINDRSRFFIENIFEELDAPHEWYLDKRQGVLYYMPPEDLNLSVALVEVPQLPHVVEFRGTKYNPVHDIRLVGFRIAHTEVTYFEPYDDPSLGDWSIHRCGSVFLEGVEDCAVENCFFDAVGGNAVFINHYAKRIRVSGNVFSQAGESAVCLVGKSHLRKDLSYICPYCKANHAWGWGELSYEVPSECVIHNNLIHDVGVFGKQTAGIFLSLSMKNTISHNYIFNTPRAAICINDGFMGGHVIEYNDVHDTVRETGDHGPFNSWGREQFWCKKQSHGPESHPAGDVKADAKYTTIIRNNRFRDRSGWGIDLDDGSSNYHVYNNLCIGISIKLREGDYRTIENNIFVNSVNPPGFHIGYENNNDRFLRNIIVMNSDFDNPEVDMDFKKGKSRGNIYDIIGPPSRGPWFKEWDNNLFFSDIGEFRMAVHFIRETPLRHKSYNLQEWRELGFDLHSVYADPMFIDPENGDYRVKPGSPALKRGFTNFVMDAWGLTGEFPERWRILTDK